MRVAKLASVVAVVAASQAMGASSVVLTPQLQTAGAPSAYATYVANWKAGTGLTLFPSGSETQGQVLCNSAAVTWSVKVDASGVQAAGNGAGFEVNGAANIVFDLELHDGSAGGPIVASAQYSSAINDGTSSTGEPTGPRVASAAFAASFNIAAKGPGRIFDVILNTNQADRPSGGPHADVKTYPTNQNDGKLLGMGAGYSQWNRTGGSAVLTTPGIGKTGSLTYTGNTLCPGTASCNALPAAGAVAAFEGQLGTANLTPNHTYVLVVVPKPGINVLRGDICLGCNQNAFAVAADGVTGGSISFQVSPTPCNVGGCTAVSLVSAASRRHHGAPANADFDIAANLSGTATIESRQAGTAPAMVLTFSGPPTSKPNGGALGCSDFTVTGGTCSSVTVSGNSAVVALTGLVKNSCLTVAATNVCTTGGSDIDVSVVLHEGNANTGAASLGVNILDLQAIKNGLNIPVTGANAKLDVTCNGAINILDLQACKNNLNVAAACP